MGAVHGTRCWPLKINALVVVPAAVARTLEFVFARLPIRRATQVRTTRVNHEEPIWRAINPDAVLLLPLRIDTQSVIRRIPDFESRCRLEKRAAPEKKEKCNEPSGKKCNDAAPHQAPALPVRFGVLWPDRF